MGRGQRDLADEALQVVDALEGLADLAPGDGRAEAFGHGVLALRDRARVAERPEKPGAEEPAARRGHGEIDDVEEGPLELAVAEVAHELEVADGRGVEDQVAARGEIGDAVDEGQGVLPDLFDVGDEGPGRGHGPGLVLEAEAGQGPGPEVLQDDAGRLGRVEEPALGRAQGGSARAVEGDDAPQGVLRAFRIEDLLGAGLEDLVGEELGFGPGALQGADLSGGQIDQGHAPAVLRQGQRDQEGALLGLLGLDLDGRARRQDLDDLAPDDALGRLGVLDLLADGHFEALPQELGQVGSDGVIGDAAHRHLLPRGQGDIEDGRGRLGVLVEHLVEIAQAEEQEGVGMELLDAEILLHHRGQGGFVGHRSPQLYPRPSPFAIKRRHHLRVQE